MRWYTIGMEGIHEFEFDADFLRWLANQDPRFLDFMFRYFRDLSALTEKGMVINLPDAPTGKRIRVRYVRNKEDLLKAAEAFEREAGAPPITDEEIKAFQQHLDRTNGINPPEKP